MIRFLVMAAAVALLIWVSPADPEPTADWQESDR